MLLLTPGVQLLSPGELILGYTGMACNAWMGLQSGFLFWPLPYDI